MFVASSFQVKDFPDFLSGKDRERCQHIRIIYAAERSEGKARDWWRRERGEGPPPAGLLSHPTVMQTIGGKESDIESRFLMWLAQDANCAKRCRLKNVHKRPPCIIVVPLPDTAPFNPHVKDVG